MARTANTFRNLIWALLAQVIILGLGLVLPRLIILTYGSAINGLTATINQLLSVLNLLQAGALGASIFALFKPIADNNYEQISLILHSSKRYFNRLGWVFLLLTVIIAPVVALNKANNEVSFEEIVLAFLILGLNASFSFFYYSRFDILFSADQKRHILSIASIVEKLTYFGLLFIILGSGIHFIFMYVAVLMGSSIKVGILYLIFRKYYAHKLLQISKGQYYEIPNKGYLLVNQISTQAVESAPIIFIAFSYDFRFVSVYSIYYLVMQMIKMVISTIQVSVSEVFGNMVVSEESERIESVFNLMMFVYIVIGTFLTTCAAFLFMPFISLYTMGMTDVNYIIPLIALVIVIYSLVYCLYMPFYTLSNAYGLYKETYLQSLITGIASLIISFIFSRYAEMPFVLVGLIAYYLFSMIYRIMIIIRHVEWFEMIKLSSRLVFYISLPISAYYFQQVFVDNAYSWRSFFGLTIFAVVATTAFIMLYILFFERKQFNELKGYITMFVYRRRAL